MTESERRQLAQIAAEISHVDAHLARTLSAPVRGRRVRRAAITLLVMSLATLLGGALARQPLVCVLAWAGLLAGVLMMLINTASP